ncbi:hypothetical protein EDD15DRAFT_1573364 [Pisolithus albus]|nr:hypothetical protein EDD15DRAFT_1573364 [Pisolithus albus]
MMLAVTALLFSFKPSCPTWSLQTLSRYLLPHAQLERMSSSSNLLGLRCLLPQRRHRSKVMQSHKQNRVGSKSLYGYVEDVYPVRYGDGVAFSRAYAFERCKNGNAHFKHISHYFFENKSHM